MKHRIFNVFVIIMALLSMVISVPELLIFFIIWIMILTQHSMETIPILVIAYLQLESYNYITLAASMTCLGVSLVMYVLGKRNRTDEEEGILKAQSLKRKKLCILSLCSMVISIADIMLYNIWPWIYW